MEEKKVLSIDTMICDLRTVSEETLQSYEKINISAMTVFVTERTQELFHRYPVNLDAMAVEKLDENVRLVEQNGVYKITDQVQAGEPTYLTISGQLQIAKGAEKALESYGMTVTFTEHPTEKTVDVTVTAERITEESRAREVLELFRKADHVTVLALPDLSGVIADCDTGADTALSAEFF